MARRALLERELRGLLILELVQVGVAVVALLALAVRTMVSCTDTASTLFVGGVLVAVVAHLVLAARTRIGIGDVRRELLASGPPSRPEERGHPYRSDPHSWN